MVDKMLDKGCCISFGKTSIAVAYGLTFITS